MMTLTTIRNRDLAARALRVLSSGKPDPGLIGSTLDEHHALPRDGLHRSTPRIESLISASKKAGALDCKINGSGGGGTILAYAPGRGKEVVEAIGEAGGVPYPAKVSRGANVAAIT